MKRIQPASRGVSSGCVIAPPAHHVQGRVSGIATTHCSEMHLVRLQVGVPATGVYEYVLASMLGCLPSGCAAEVFQGVSGMGWLCAFS
jgi:hypothetical protein